jgi:hypothetical protein
MKVNKNEGVCNIFLKTLISFLKPKINIELSALTNVSDIKTKLFWICIIDLLWRLNSKGS